MHCVAAHLLLRERMLADSSQQLELIQYYYVVSMNWWPRPRFYAKLLWGETENAAQLKLLASTP